MLLQEKFRWAQSLTVTRTRIGVYLRDPQVLKDGAPQGCHRADDDGFAGGSLLRMDFRPRGAESGHQRQMHVSAWVLGRPASPCGLP